MLIVGCVFYFGLCIFSRAQLIHKVLCLISPHLVPHRTRLTQWRGWLNSWRTQRLQSSVPKWWRRAAFRNRRRAKRHSTRAKRCWNFTGKVGESHRHHRHRLLWYCCCWRWSESVGLITGDVFACERWSPTKINGKIAHTRACVRVYVCKKRLMS